MEEIRAFIALELPSQVKTVLSEILAELGPRHQHAAKWVSPDGLHLTLKFLGNIPFAKVSHISTIIERSCVDFRAFDLVLSGLGAFPNVKSPRVVWVGVDGEVSGIETLQRRIDQGLVPLGFPPEKRAFSPHLTLGRVRDHAVSRDCMNLAQALALVKLPETPAFTVSRISLIKSTLTKSGAIYERLSVISLDRI